MSVFKIVCCYALGVLIFPFSWLCEQPGAIKVAYWDSIGSAHAHVKKRLKEETQ